MRRAPYDNARRSEAHGNFRDGGEQQQDHSLIVAALLLGASEFGGADPTVPEGDYPEL